jgi:hypothetical protein
MANTAAAALGFGAGTAAGAAVKAAAAEAASAAAGSVVAGAAAAAGAAVAGAAAATGTAAAGAPASPAAPPAALTGKELLKRPAAYEQSNDDHISDMISNRERSIDEMKIQTMYKVPHTSSL